MDIYPTSSSSPTHIEILENRFEEILNNGLKKQANIVNEQLSEIKSRMDENEKSLSELVADMRCFTQPYKKLEDVSDPVPELSDAEKAKTESCFYIFHRIHCLFTYLLNSFLSLFKE
jgi:hypothetical protein